MSITFTNNQFHLTNGYISYIIGLNNKNEPVNLYFGSKISVFRSLYRECGRQGDAWEYPAYGTGDYLMPAFELKQANGSIVTAFKYQCHEINQGKPKLTPLPATYTEDDKEAETLKITLYDELIGAKLILSYTIFKDYPVIARNALFINEGKEAFSLTRALSCALDFHDKEFALIHLSGSWAREREIIAKPLSYGTFSDGSISGTSGSEFNPFIALKRPETTENTGEVYGFSLVYSGNHINSVEVSTHGKTRVTQGINPLNFAWRLDPKSCFQTPESVMVYSDKGLNAMSAAYHKLYRTRLARGTYRDSARPILINNWEATYFDFNEDKLLKIAQKAKEAGIELFVLDDGWFGHRDDDTTSLGDWFTDTKKLPDGIGALSRKITALGLKFGLWFEPEMISKDSELYRAHPDWHIHTPGRFETPMRSQHTLDFSRREIVDYIYEQMAAILKEADISYIKWDMNRYFTEPFSKGLPCERQGELFHRYILGVYDLYTRLTAEFPDILFESCASGGQRFDPGMLYFAPQAWCSDDTDAYERLKIQYGSSYVYPLSSIGAHVSACPNHQLGRTTPIKSRAHVAYFGTFGYELDLNTLKDEEFNEVKEQVAFMKKHRDLIQHNSVFYRLLNPMGNEDGAWMIVSFDKKEALVLYFAALNTVNREDIALRLIGLEEETVYNVKVPHGEYMSSGSELMRRGIMISREWIRCDFDSLLMEVNALCLLHDFLKIKKA